MAVVLQPAQGFRVAVFRLEDDTAPQPFDQSALSRHTELRGKLRLDVRDRLQVIVFRYMNHFT